MLAEALKSKSSVTSIDLSVTAIGAEGASTLADALKANISLTSIYLSSDEIGDEGASVLANALLNINTCIDR
jgi:Ran GTPase-activating protein (RanGAP) involved in mRNA processing and transport